MVENHEKWARIKRPMDEALQGGRRKSREVARNSNIAVSRMCRLEQSENEFARSSHLTDVKCERLRFDEGAKQTRFAHPLWSKKQQRFANLGLVSKPAQLFLAPDAGQIFGGWLALGRRRRHCCGP